MERKNAWKSYDENNKKELEILCKEYREFLSAGKTERECVKEILKEAEAKLNARLVEQDRYFANPENKAKWEKERQDNLVNERFCW